MTAGADPGPEARPADFGWSEWRPRIWHGMGLRAWSRLVSGNLPRIAPRRMPLALTIGATAALHSALGALERMFAAPPPSLRPDPLVILGFWRSGTTFLHEMLAADPRHVAPDNFACLMPLDFRLLRPAAGAFGRLLPPSRPMDRVPLAVDAPQEDEFAILNLGLATPYRYMGFPSQGHDENAQRRYWPAAGADADRWMRDWRNFLARVCAEAPGRRLVLKSPPHLARLRAILATFPEARFVHLSREPVALFQSNLKMHRAMGATQGLERRLQGDGQVRDGVIAMHRRLYDAFAADHALIPDGRLLELRYEELVADPLKVAASIYRGLDLGDFAAARPAIGAFVKARRGHRADAYVADGELTARLHQEWPRYCRAFGYAPGCIASSYCGWRDA
jgi:LPS sulfotransferase NodH